MEEIQEERKSQEDKKRVETEREGRTRHPCLRGVEIGSMTRGKQSQDMIEDLQRIQKVTGKSM